MNIPRLQKLDKIFNAFCYLIATLGLALAAIGIINYFLDDGSWINYLIVVVILSCASLVVTVGKKFNSARGDCYLRGGQDGG